MKIFLIPIQAESRSQFCQRDHQPAVWKQTISCLCTGKASLPYIPTHIPNYNSHVPSSHPAGMSPYRFSHVEVANVTYLQGGIFFSQFIRMFCSSFAKHRAETWCRVSLYGRCYFHTGLRILLELYQFLTWFLTVIHFFSFSPVPTNCRKN